MRQRPIANSQVEDTATGRPTTASGEAAPTRTVIDVNGLAKTYGQGASMVRAIEDVTLSVRQGEFLSIVGPSGCGKTTLLMCMAGLRSITGGAVRLKGQEIREPVPGLAVVFQDYSRSLFPWFTNAGNVAAALWDTGLSKRETRKKADAALHSVGLGDVGGLYPWQLSGGMQQRVAIARALVTSPEVLLMDEPFASVDAQSRAILEDLLLSVWDSFGVTVVFITHDIDESVYLSDRVAVLSHRPSRVLSMIDIDLPRPRNQLETRASARFGALRSDVYRLVMAP